MIYAGQPDTLIVLILSLAVFVVALLVIRGRRQGIRTAYRPVLDLALGSVAGIGLAAPLLLPAAQVSAGSIRGVGRHTAFPAFDILHTIFQSYDGLALAGGISFGLPFWPTYRPPPTSG